MADSKRASLGNRVATPRVGGAQSSGLSTEAAIARCTGARVRVTTTAQKVHESYIFSVHQQLNLLTLTPTFPPAPNTVPAFTILPLSTIHSFTILSLPTPAAKLPSLPQVDTSTQQARLRAAIARVQIEDARRGKGVSREAQEIFDALARTLPARWEGENIIVLEEVTIAKPYRAEDCVAGKSVGGQMLTRIRKVLENERKKIADRASGSSQAGAAPRKGG